jgi:transposase-like protein
MIHVPAPPLHPAAISQSFLSQLWKRIINFFAYPEEIRRIIYTSNPIESLNSTRKKTIKNRTSFPNDKAAINLLHLSLKNIRKKWTMPARNWGLQNQQYSRNTKPRPL